MQNIALTRMDNSVSCAATLQSKQMFRTCFNMDSYEALSITRTGLDTFFSRGPSSGNKETASYCTHSQDNGNSIEYIVETDQIHK